MALGFASQAASTMTIRCARNDYLYQNTQRTLINGMGSRQHGGREKVREVGEGGGISNGAGMAKYQEVEERGERLP